MAEIIKFEVTYDELLKLADKAFEDKDAVRFFDCLKRAVALDPSRPEAKLKLCEAYAALGCYELSNDVAFRALDCGVEETCFIGKPGVQCSDVRALMCAVVSVISESITKIRT